MSEIKGSVTIGGVTYLTSVPVTLPEPVQAEEVTREEGATRASPVHR